MKRLFIICLILFSKTILIAQLEFSDPILVHENDLFIPTYFDLADLDNDGDLDVVAGTIGDNKIVWYENMNNTGAFDTQKIIDDDIPGARYVSAVDIDNDTDLDILTIQAEFYGYFNKIVLYKKIGNDAFSAPIEIYTHYPQIHSIDIIDLDGDNDKDILLGYNDRIEWLENLDSTDAFSAGITIFQDETEFVYGVKAADLDDDGDMDIVQVSYLGTFEGNTCSWFENTDGLANFSPEIIIDHSFLDEPFFVTTSDLDGDMDLDIVVTNYHTIQWYDNSNGSGSFTYGGGIGCDLGPPGYNFVDKNIHITDLDGDFDMDILWLSNRERIVAWIENINGNGRFGPSIEFIPDVNDPCCIQAGDIDGDSDQDVLFASNETDQIYMNENKDGAGTFHYKGTVNRGIDWITSITCSDLDGDGDKDILASSGCDHKIMYFENMDGTGSFGEQNIISTEVLNPREIFSADLDADGDMDVLSASYDDNKIVWYENSDGKGTFLYQNVISTNAQNANHVFAIDLDSDQDIDVISSSTGDHKIAWYENYDGNGNFGDQIIITVDLPGVISIFSADLDNDGDNDILGTSSENGKVVWYENINGLGEFSNEIIIASTESSVGSVTAVDLDRDGDMDVLSFYGSYVAWYENVDGVGSFDEPRFITSGDMYLQDFYVRDIDGDNDLDVCGIEGSNFCWVENDNTKFLQKQKILLHDEYIIRSYFDDLNGDGDLDVILGLEWDDIVWIRYETGPSENAIDENMNPISFTLLQNHPNPFNPLTQISYSIADKGHVRLTVYDVRSREIMRLVDEVKSAGTYSADFNGSALSSGVYVYRLETGDEVLTKKMVLMK